MNAQIFYENKLNHVYNMFCAFRYMLKVQAILITLKVIILVPRILKKPKGVVKECLMLM